jgi:putative NADPH-quinone reductase
MARIAIIDAHPDPARERFVHALADAYAEGAAAAHEVRRLRLAELDFPLLRSMDEWMNGPVPESLRDAQQAIRWADHLVFLYPLWLGDMPALLKAFLEQVARPGFALEYASKRFPRKLLKGKSARLVVTMGMPALFYRLVYRAHSLKSLERNILSFVGIRPIRHNVIGSVESSDRYRRNWIEKMRRLGRAGR